ncbi:uncharacterized protein LOC103871002 [Brassica rapa]|uniref:uncharacterized protein LOC103871002 n=1 Tax=Brassica campestris TaxID=3711 RepID=UPI00142DBC5C|nr:uncharacterized protein LOC103871002 [Brassica rapa]
MASACVKSAGVSPAGYSLYGRMSLRREERRSENQDQAVDFEFCPEDPVTMLSADELFSDGKLVPLKFSGPETTRRPQTSTVKTEFRRRVEMEMSELFSPKAPRCTTRWRELLGLKKAHESSSSSSSPNPKTLKRFLHRGSKSSSPPADATPLLMKESDMASSRLSLSSSSSSSGHEIDDLPRLSLDLDKPSPNPFAPPSRTTPRIRLAKPRRPSNPTVDGVLNVTADSPRLNASGKIVFHGLERSSSSPGSFTGGPRLKQHHGMPRSYSANVRVSPVLNVPVSSLKSSIFFAQMFSSSPGNKSQLQSNGKNQTNRTRLEPKCEQN